jgi:3-methyladenine DNA glycosylase/8-oxoguanine DNA glycosylase
LEPFKWDNDKEILYTIVSLDSTAYKLSIKESSQNLIINTAEVISSQVKNKLINVIRRILSFDEDIYGLEQLCRERKEQGYLELIYQGWGRIMKSPSAWEDAVKTICTTNASWSFTKQMCSNLCFYLGNNRSFPEPIAVFNSSEKFLKETIKLGYRSLYVHNLASEIFMNQLNLDNYSVHICEQKTAEKKIKAIKGLGPYGVNHMLALLGWNEYLPIDREVMKFLNIKQKKPNDKCPWRTEHYNDWGKYRFIIYKLDRIMKDENWIGD